MVEGVKPDAKKPGAVSRPGSASVVGRRICAHEKPDRRENPGVGAQITSFYFET
jgi:hypothetical protein